MENQEQKKEEQKQENKIQAVCQTHDCDKPATLQCPTCVKLGLSPAYFCSQPCFKRFWPIHKLFHKKPDELKEKNSKFKFTGPLRPGNISARSQVPEHIKKPDWASTGIPYEELNSKYTKNLIAVQSHEDLVKMWDTGKIARGALDLGHSMVKPGVTTDEIDKAVHQYIIDNDGYPSPLNYHKFRKSLCTSVNEVICHGIPDDRPLEDGDIVNLDVTVYKNGKHVDLNETYHVGKVDPSSAFLVEKSYRCLEEAQKLLKPGTMYRDLGNVIGKYIEDHGLSVTRTYCGHGIGDLFHCAPNVPHYQNNKAPGFMKVGHTFTIEPMINQGTWKDVTWPDEWTAVTADGQRSSQFEQTFVIVEGGYEIISKRNEQSPALDFNC